MTDLREDLRTYFDQLAASVDADVVPPSDDVPRRRSRALRTFAVAACAVLLATGAVALIITTSGDDTPSAPSQSCTRPCLATPRAAARTFYAAAATSDLSTLRAATNRARWSELASTANPDVGNLRCARPVPRKNGTVDSDTCRRGALSRLQVERVEALGAAELPPDIDRDGIDRWAQATVTFNALYRAQDTAQDGQQARQLILGRERESKRWRVFSAVPVPAETSTVLDDGYFRTFYPSSWQRQQSGQPSIGSPIIWLGNQPMHDPCTVTADASGLIAGACGLPTDQLEPGTFVLALSHTDGPTPPDPASLERLPGRSIQIDGQPGKIATRNPTPDECGTIGATRVLAAKIIVHGSSEYEMLACLRGPDLDVLELQIESMVRSTTFNG